MGITGVPFGRTELSLRLSWTEFGALGHRGGSRGPSGLRDARKVRFLCFSKTYFFFKQKKSNESWKSNFSGIPWTQGPSGPSLCPRAPNSVQDSLNESSVRPNGTPVMPILRSRKTQFLFSSFLLDFNPFLASGKHLPEERKTPIGPIHVVFLLCPT